MTIIKDIFQHFRPLTFIGSLWHVFLCVAKQPPSPVRFVMK